MTVKIEAKTQDGEWADLTRYMQLGGEHVMRELVINRRPLDLLSIGPRTEQRRAEYARRVKHLKLTLDATGGTGNMMVQGCRAHWRMIEADRAERRKQGDSARRPTAPHHPNERLRTYGIKVALDPNGPGLPILAGGTARQRASYQRVTRRYVG
jgi:hypothetical protein